MSDIIEHIISQNKTWAQKQKKEAPDYFTNLSKGQSPSIFFVGCCDSRVIPSEIFQCSLGEMFVQTNIANQIRTDDINTMSSLEYAVNVLKVSHIIICGHTFCGGITASMTDTQSDLSADIQKWIHPIHKIYQAEKQSLPQSNEFERVTALSRANVRHQVKTTANLDLIKSLPAQKRKITIYGQLFHLETGVVEKLETLTIG